MPLKKTLHCCWFECRSKLDKYGSFLRTTKTYSSCFEQRVE